MNGDGGAAARLVAAAGWRGASVAPVAGDASARRFSRLSLPGRSAILMEDPAPGGGASAAFVSMAGWLRAQGYSAPEILAADIAAGVLLVEDLGDMPAARICAADPDAERAIHDAAADLLADLQGRPPPPGLGTLDGEGLAGLTAIVGEWLLPGLGLVPDEPGAFGRAVRKAWDALPEAPLAVSLRDFFTGNIVWLPERRGLARVGLLDFQDAVLAHPAYDLVSLLQDARRDPGAGIEARAKARHIAATGADPEAFEAAYALMGAQRALRILGVFARLALRDGKPGYLAHVGRVRANLDRNLAHPSLAELREIVAAQLPPIGADALSRLGEASGAHPRAAMLFAAGFGTRMGSLAQTTPKPLIRVAGRALLDHALDQTAGAGVERIVINLHYLADSIRRHVGADDRILFSDETDLILETGGGIRKALPLLGRGPVFTLNTDAVWTGPNPLATLRAHWRPDRMDALLLLVPRGRATGHAGAGDFLCDGDGRLSRGPGAVYTGAQIIRTEPFAAATDRVFSQNAVWDGIAARGRLFGVLHPGGWCDVGRPASIPLAERLLSEAGRADAV
ncbi:MAG: phosphotransferase [Pseudomonadota bacterium]